MHSINTFHEFGWHHLGTTWTTLMDYSDNLETTWELMENTWAPKGNFGTTLRQPGDNFGTFLRYLYDNFDTTLR